MFEAAFRTMVAAMFACPLVLSACDGGSDGGEGGSGGQGSSQSSTGSSAQMSSSSSGGEKEAFLVKGVTGKEVLLDQLWDQGCVPGQQGADWTDAKRTLTGLELVFTLIDYQNGSATPDCENGRIGTVTYTLQLTNDNVSIPITWVDPNGDPAAAPPGLEAITSANGAEALMTAATITPETKERADQLNAAKQCGFSDWEAGKGKEVVDCLTMGFNPFKGTLVVDDRTMPWKVYDGTAMTFDANGYPTSMANYLPHSGPFPVK